MVYGLSTHCRLTQKLDLGIYQKKDFLFPSVGPDDAIVARDDSPMCHACAISVEPSNHSTCFFARGCLGFSEEKSAPARTDAGVDLRWWDSDLFENIACSD